MPIDPNADRWLAQTVVEHSSSSRQARETVTAWLMASDTALALGAATTDAQFHADAAYRVAATRAALPTIERKAVA